MTSADKTLTCIKHVAIIGSGPTGIACAKHLLAEQVFDTIDVYEQRSNVGGIWNLSGTEKSKQIPFPQLNPRYGATKDVSNSHSNNDSLEFESPLYDYLETNIPKTLMAYSDTPFHDDLPLFPKHNDVLRYLEEYARPVKHLIQFHTQVVNLLHQDSVNKSANASARNGEWELTSKDLNTGIIQQANYDAIVVANGHYTVPHVPFIPGLAEWHQKYPDTVIHSKSYRRPEDFTKKKVLVIGNSASGLDIATQLAPYAETPVILASRSASQLAPKGGGPTWRKDVPEIEEFLLTDHDRAVRTKSGEILTGFESVIFATGYFYSFPFISDLQRSSASTPRSSSPAGSATSKDLTGLADVTTSGLRTHDVYKHFLHIDYPTLALPVLNLKVIPFPLAENEAAVIARLWSGRLDTPSQETMRNWEKDEEQRLLDANRLRPAPNTASGNSVTTAEGDDASESLKFEGGFHTLVYPEDANQINTLYDWAVSARPRDGLSNNGTGKLGTQWNERQVWLRGQFPDIKAAYTKLGDQRAKVTSLEMLGEQWKHGFERWNEHTSENEKKKLFSRAAVTGY